jgi:hypothetical protein
MKNYPKILMVVCLLSWSSPAIAQTLPCLDSSKECVELLTQRAIANSAKLKTLNDRIALIDKRLGVSKDSIDYANNKLWTNYLPSSTAFGGSVLDIINPFAWVKNLAGGGDMQRDRIAIADLEIKAATLEAARAELERQREEEKVLLGDKVLTLLLDYEAATRRVKLIESQIQSFNVSREVFRIRYRLGEGTTEQLLGVEERGDRYRVRWQMMKRHQNPLGILYSIYADPDIRVRSPALPYSR